MENSEKLPSSLIVTIIALILLAIISIIGPVSYALPWLGSVSNFALLLTLIVLIIYTYYTYKVASYTYKAAIEPQTPVASFYLRKDPQHPYHFYFRIKNYSKVSINCWCKLNPKINGKNVSLDHFYGGKSSFPIQPYGESQGHFYITDIISKSESDLKQLEVSSKTKPNRDLVYFDMEFYYQKLGEEEIHYNPKQPCYYNFESREITLDF